MSELRTPALLTILEEWQFLPSFPPMWRCTLKSENGTVIHTWETESVPFYLPPLSTPCAKGGAMGTPAGEYGATKNCPGDGT